MSAHKIVLGLILSSGLLMTAGSALADGQHGGPFGGPFGGPGHGGPDHGGDKGAAAPELAGHGAPAALALIAGGAAVVISRRRRQS